MQLGTIFYNEHISGCSLAIKELVNSTYQIFPDEYGNPFKELINFTIRYFKNLFDQNQKKPKIY